MSFTTETVYDAAKKIWHGPPRVHELYEEQATLGGEILKALKKFSHKVLQINDDDGSEKTAENLLLESQTIAVEFLSMGLKPGNIIGIFAANTSNLTAVIIAALFCGCPWHAIYPEFEGDLIKQIYGLTSPKIICCDMENYAVLKTVLEQMKSQAIVYIVNGKLPKVQNIDDILQSSNIKNFDEKTFPGLSLSDTDATVAIICSSGTTGQPKGVTLSHRSILNNIVYRDVDAHSTLFCYSTLFWISGLWTLLTSLLNGAKRIISKKPATPESFLNLIAKNKVTHVMTSTSLMAQLVAESTVDKEQRLASVHSLYYGGSKISAKLAEKLYNLFDEINSSNKLGPIVCYGMTELSGMLAQTYTKTVERRFDTEGKLLPNMQAKIKDRESDKFLGPNELGFIYIRLPYKWAGYYQNEQATQKVYEEATGWFNSGDVGYFDQKGFIYLCGRESDIFKSNGFHIYPNRLEEIILKIPGVAQVCVFGVPDAVAINLPACAIVRTKDAKGLELTKANVEDYVKQHVAKMFHIKGGVYFLEQLPKTASDKPLRRKVYDTIKENKLN